MAIGLLSLLLEVCRHEQSLAVAVVQVAPMRLPRGRLVSERSMVERQVVTAADIARQRDLAWRDWHPEDFCHRCGHPNVKPWSVDPKIWAEVFPQGVSDPWEGIICPQCFVELAEVGHVSTTWRIVPNDFAALGGDEEEETLACCDWCGCESTIHNREEVECLGCSECPGFLTNDAALTGGDDG